MNFTTLFRSKSIGWIIQLFRYTIVGGIAFVVDFGLLWLLTDHAGIPYLVSGCISFIAGLILNYTLSSIWVFGHSTQMSRKAEFLIFAIIGEVGLALNAGLLFLFSDVCGIHYLISKIISTIIVFVWNFTGRRILMTSSKANLIIWKRNQSKTARP